MNSFSLIRRNHVSADRTREILGLPEHIEWSDLKVEFGLDDVGTVTMTILATGEQIADLAKLAVQEIDSPVDDRQETRRRQFMDCGWACRAAGQHVPGDPECVI